ncbi:hypothetical protein OG749_47050 (plasmid) [Streptomyces nojiriensis]|uniref:hypothetical protein n=1 Tax=Streptomyces nojiriensis TaxID=66374 RepID=UPI002E171628
MLPAPDLKEIVSRLESVRLDPWGPDGVRYVCVLFWDNHGYRHLTNQIDWETWQRWHRSSGEFWDLFLAGCYCWGPQDYYGDEGLALTPEEDRDHPPVRWSQRQSDSLARDIASEAHRAGAPPWRFSGPLELVAVGARHAGHDVDIDWASLRFAKMPPNELSMAVSDYTEAHISLDSGLAPSPWPSPGDFRDDLPRELKRDLLERVGLLNLLFNHP